MEFYKFLTISVRCLWLIIIISTFHEVCSAHLVNLPNSLPSLITYVSNLKVTATKTITPACYRFGENVGLCADNFKYSKTGGSDHIVEGRSQGPKGISYYDDQTEESSSAEDIDSSLEQQHLIGSYPSGLIAILGVLVKKTKTVFVTETAQTYVEETISCLRPGEKLPVDFCTIRDPCTDNPCADDGDKDAKCIPLSQSSYKCECSPGYIADEKKCYACGKSHFKSSGAKIVGGEEAIPGAYPWIALLYSERNRNGMPALYHPGCAGSLITSKYIMTAKHCESARKMYAHLGVHNATATSPLNPSFTTAFIEVKQFITYDDIEETFPKGPKHDIAIIELVHSVVFSPLIAPICLPFSSKPEETVNVVATVAGWGITKAREGYRPPLRPNNETNSSNVTTDLLYRSTVTPYNKNISVNKPPSEVLKHLRVPILPQESCKNYGEAGVKFNNTVHICAGYPEGDQGTCQGDSGGPLMIDNKGGKVVQVGIVSFGNGCAFKDYPGVYQRVSYYLDWIEKVINDS
ncbi:transmembrane protease serine 4-like [Artemia franciscana]|uniref:Uncharacterized protein n=1 Tax=Artemia franciscana TaxID=6661 RepID=A0AA88I984_ARTSF|nr:hypothetical protein QYM36_006292 [Artemia franciscana]